MPPRLRALGVVRKLWSLVFAPAASSRLIQVTTAHESLGVPWIFQAAFAGWFLFARCSRPRLMLVDLPVLLSLSGLSLRAALAGEPTCGCFGAVVVTPWLTFGFVALASILSALGPAIARSDDQGLRRVPRVGTIYVLAPLTLAVGFLVIVGSSHLRSVGTADGGIGQVPESWVDRDFSMLKEIDLGPILREGDWIVVLHRRQCPACRTVIEQVLARARSSAAKTQDTEPPRVALVEVPPFDPDSPAGFGADPRIHSGRLRETQPWTFRTPQIVRLSDGRILSVRSPRPSGP